MESPDLKTDPNTLFDSLRSKLRSWRCQNQGYILDGFPLTMSQATTLFKGCLKLNLTILGEESTSILPEYVISIDANDDFLRGRAISAVESELGQSDGNELENEY